ncbi:MAG: DNA-directed RNA polymerase subunit omega [Flammeovirgaceae bacterium]|nr:DNA-directed RNA polymerase subunit omega [Flammeovirgaceae bacterium]
MANASLITRDVPAMTHETGNTYESVVIIGKRARQISTKLKEELNSKLAEFATTVDNLEEVFENREQIEISKFYERMPKATSIATEEFVEEKVYFKRGNHQQEEEAPKLDLGEF